MDSAHRWCCASAGMSESEDRKRDRSLSPHDAVQDREKQRREKSPDVPVTHISVMNATDLHKSPVSTKSPHSVKGTNLLERCREMGIDGSPPAKIDVQQLHSLFIQLEGRVLKQENELSDLKKTVSEKDDQIFKLRKDNVFLQKQISDVRVDSLHVPMPPPVDLSQELAVANDALAKAEENIDRLSRDCRELKETRERLDQKYKMYIRRLHLEEDRLTQYTMRDSVKIFGVPYKAGEDTNDLVRRIGYSLGVEISEHDISVSHRTGKIHGNKPRPIVAKFTRRATKHAFLRNRSNAKNIRNDDEGNPVKIFVDEHITPMRGKVCKRLREKQVRYTTRDGKIIIDNEGSDKVIIDFPEDWDRLDLSVSEKEELGIFPKW